MRWPTLKPKETDHQKIVFNWVRLQRIRDWRFELVFAVAGEQRLLFLVSQKSKNRSFSPVAAFLKNMAALGIKKGTPDILALCPGAGFPYMTIELKREGNDATAEQIQFAEFINRAGGLAVVVTGHMPAIDLLTRYFNNQKDLKSWLMEQPLILMPVKK